MINTRMSLLLIYYLISPTIHADTVDQKTEGNNSPIYNNTHGDFTINYNSGVPIKDYAELKESTGSIISKLQQERASHIRKYKEISQELKNRFPSYILNEKGRKFLDEGELQKAKKIFKESLADNQKKRDQEVKLYNEAIAKDRYFLGLVEELNLNYEEAQSHYQHAAELFPKKSTYLNQVGKINYELGRYKKAIEYHDRALARNLKMYNEDHPSVVNDRINLGEAWLALNHNDEAVKYLELALDSVPRENYQSAIYIHTELGDIWRSLGQEKKASDHYKAILAIASEANEESHQNLLNICNKNWGLWYSFDKKNKVTECSKNETISYNLKIGLTWLQLANYEKAIEYCELVLNNPLNTHGKTRLEVMFAQLLSVIAWRELGNDEKALEYLKLTSASYSKIFDDKYSDKENVRVVLGLAWLSLGNHEKAIPYIKLAFDNTLKTYGEMHPRVATARLVLGITWQASNNPEKAFKNYKLALDSDLKTFGKNHPAVALDRFYLGIGWLGLDKPQEAITSFQLALSSDLNTYEEAHPKISSERYMLGMIWFSQGNNQKAMEYYQLALSSDLKTYGEMHPKVAFFRRILGMALVELGEDKKAVENLELSMDTDFYANDQAHPAYEKFLRETEKETILKIEQLKETINSCWFFC